MKRTFGLAWLFGVSVLGAAACSSDGAGDGAVESDHTAGEYVQENHPLYWTESSFEEFRRVSEAGSWSSNPQPAAKEDIAQAWLQAWSDRIDAIVRAKVLADTGSDLVAPKPIMHLLPSSSISNAWVTSIPACVPWKIRAAITAPPVDDQEDAGTTEDAGTEDAGVPDSVLLFNHYGKKVSQLTETQANDTRVAGCVERLDFAEHQKMFLRHWNEGVPNCAANVGDDGVIEVPSECVSGLTEAARAAIYSTSPHVQFASDLLAAGSEAGAVFVVAHELAHYYRSHGSPLARHKYGFWYDQDPKTTRRPVASKEGAELKALYEEVLALPRANGLVLPGATYTPRFRALAVGAFCQYIRATAEGGSEGLDESCSTAVTACGAVSSFAYSSSASEEQLASYLALETALPTCANTLSLGSVADVKVTQLITQLQAESYLPAGPVESVPIPESFGALVSQLQIKAAEFDAKVEKFAERLRLGRIGLYTTEQEADELALEWVNLLGFTTDQALNGWLDYLGYFEKWGPPYGQPSAQECRTMYGNNFKDGNKFTTVFLGDLDSAHHAGCYRVYNLWREQRAHRYVPAALTRPEVATWEQVLEQAKALSANATNPYE